MLTSTVKQILNAEDWTIDHLYRLYVIRESDIIFYVGHTPRSVLPPFRTHGNR
jgi:hypothetical protein